MRALLFVAVVSVAVACDAEPTSDPITFTLVAGGDLFATPGGSVDVPVELTAVGIAGPIQLTAAGLPADVTSAPVTIMPGHVELTLHLEVAPGAAIGRFPLTIRAEAGEERVDALVTLEVGIAGGGLDPSFGGSGLTLVDRGGAEDLFTDAALGPDQRVVLVGVSAWDALLLARTDVDGGLDPGFAGGAVISDLPVEGRPEVEVDHNGRPLVLSRPVRLPQDPNAPDRALRRWLRSGEPDPTYAPAIRGELAADHRLLIWRTGGRDVALVLGWYDTSAYTDDANEVVVQSTVASSALMGGLPVGAVVDGVGGRWVASTQQLFHADPRGAVVRDAASREIIAPVPAPLVATRASIGIAATPEGGAVLAGIVTRDVVAAAVARYDVDGSTTSPTLVPGFRRAGTVGCAIALDRAQRTLVTCPSDTHDRLRVARLLPDGRLDVRFGQRGVVEHALGTDVVPLAIFVDTADRIVVAGSLIPPGRGDHDGFVARLVP